MTPTEAAWAAGFFDGEGSIGFKWYWSNRPTKKGRSNVGPWWVLQIMISNTDLPSMERFREIMNDRGHLYTHKKETPARKKVWQWICTGLLAETCLRAMQPYSVTKLARIELALEGRLLGDYRRGNVPRTQRRVSRETWRRLIEIENEIRRLNGANYHKYVAVEADRESVYVVAGD